MSNLIDSLKGCTDSILGIRESVGADIERVKLITRTWSGRERGDGDYQDVEIDVRPTPRIVDVAHSLRLVEGGAVKQGDRFIQQISKNQFPLESDIDCSTDSGVVEKFYRIGAHDYTLISIKEKHLTWDVQVRRRSAQPASTDWRNGG